MHGLFEVLELGAGIQSGGLGLAGFPITKRGGYQKWQHLRGKRKQNSKAAQEALLNLEGKSRASNALETGRKQSKQQSILSHASQRARERRAEKIPLDAATRRHW